MSAYQIVPCEIRHLRELARTMRRDDAAEIAAVGLTIRHVLIGLRRLSPQPKAAIVDGDVAAAWGDSGPLLADEGSMWLFTSPPIERVPLAFFREARREIADRLAVRRVLRAHVACDYMRALRFFGMLGFAASEPITIGAGLYREIRIERSA